MQDSAKILVIDDTPTNLEVVTETLSSRGYSIATSISGDRALKRLQTYHPDLILLDVQMPGIDGFETCRQIKANPATGSIPIIFMTALSDTSSKVKGFSLGAVDYVTKPFQEEELLVRVNTHLQLSSLTRVLEQKVAERTAELQSALEQLSRSQLQLIQNEKMASLGNLVAGIAHEVNNPIGFLKGSINNAKDYVQDLIEHLMLYQKHYSNVPSCIQEDAENIDLDFLCQDLPKLLDSMNGATDRIRCISTSLRTFSRADAEHKISANLHEGIDSTLLILKYRLKANEHRPAIEVIQDYGDLPEIECFPGQLNQVFMNILANAIDALEDMNRSKTFTEIAVNPNQIAVQTRVEADHVLITIADNGPGIPEAIKPRIFDHLFTTKTVGKGTGLGLAIAHQIIVEKHGGTIHCCSTIGQGTEFIIQLPI